MHEAVRGAFEHTAISVPATKSRRARMPFTPSQMVDIYGYDFLYRITVETFRAFATRRTSRPCPDSDQIYIHLPDVHGYLQEELWGAYRFLSNPCNADLWQFCTPELVAAIRGHETNKIWAIRQQFKGAVVQKTSSEATPHTATAALAWAIIVESALLTDQLVQDMKEAAAAKGCPPLPTCWLPYFLPDPPPEARRAFNDYVRCRWPIHVFALDPVMEEQNIADVFSGRREMQLAMSLAFVNGQLSASNMMRYARRIEFDFSTVDLNGTAVGFSHGDDTFGWRFYPRFQTPDIEGNATVIFRDLLIGGPSRDALLRQRRLEPGIRECVAVVIMPSFVPYATMNVSSNWFSLTNPKCKELDTRYAMKLSRAVKSIENCAPNVGDACCYRDGDFERLLQKAKQLEARLPLQSTVVQIPYENTLGGFAMFNTGVTDLAPELTGWYGSPSINPKQPTTLFLVGNHFSVHQTRVIAGGQPVMNQELLSRQVMKVVIPANPIQLGDACQKFVDIQVATPYGVTPHMPVPVCIPPKDDAQPSGIAWKPAAVSVAYVFGGVGIAPPQTPSTPATDPAGLVIQTGVEVDGKKLPYANVTLSFDAPYDSVSVSFTDVAYVDAQKGYVITGGDFATAVFKAFGSRFGPEAMHPPCTLTTKQTKVTLKASPTPAPAPAPAAPAPAAPVATVPVAPAAPAPANEKVTANQLTIQWIKAPPVELKLAP